MNRSDTGVQLYQRDRPPLAVNGQDSLANRHDDLPTYDPGNVREGKDFSLENSLIT